MAEEAVLGRKLKMRIVKISKRADSRHKQAFNVFAVVTTPDYGDPVIVSSNYIEGDIEYVIDKAKAIAGELQEELYIFGYDIVVAN